MTRWLVTYHHMGDIIVEAEDRATAEAKVQAALDGGQIPVTTHSVMARNLDIIPDLE